MKKEHDANGMCEDILMTIRYISKDNNEDQLSDFFVSHVNLMIGLITFE